MTEPRFYDLLTELERIIAEDPIEENLARFSELIKDKTLYKFAFSNLLHSNWVQPLNAKGFFTNPPPPVHDESKGTVYFPFWPESECLARIAKVEPEVAQSIILGINTNNVRVHEDFASAALSMPPSMAAKWVEHEVIWLESQNDLSIFRLPDQLAKVAVHISKGGHIDSALLLIRVLLEVFPDPKNNNGEKQSALPREPRARFDIGEYEIILQKHLPEVTAIATESVLLLLCDLLNDVVRFSLSRPDEVQPEDYSYIWQPAIEHDEQHVLKNVLVSTVRDTSLEIAQKDTSQIPRVVNQLESYHWIIFQRISLHLLRHFSQVSTDIIAERLTDRKLFYSSGLRHEYALLSRECFSHLTLAAQDQILGFIDSGPDTENYKSNREKFTGQPVDEAQIDLYVASWKLERLAPIQHEIPENWKLLYDDLLNKLGQPRDELEYVGRTVWEGPTSPKSIEDLRSMKFSDIVEFLHTWQPIKQNMFPSPEGLSRELRALVSSDPERFASEALQFRELQPEYIRGLLGGFQDALKQNRSFLWTHVLGLCAWVVEQPIKPEDEDNKDILNSDWGSTRESVAELLSTGFESTSSELPYEFRHSAWAVLRVVTEDPNPTLEYEARYGGSNMDPATLSLNTTRGEAMHAVIRYALWVRRNLEKTAEGKASLDKGFEEMPEVREILDAHIDYHYDASLAIRSVYGQWFPWLVLLDSAWAKSKAPAIFPFDEEMRTFRNAAWNTYITFCTAYDNVFDVLTDQYKFAVEHIRAGASEQALHRRNPDARLAEHLMVFYWRGKLTLENPQSLLTTFFNEASADLRSHAIGFIGQSLSHTESDVQNVILERLIRLWSWRTQDIDQISSHTLYCNEWVSFGWWFASSKFDDNWAIGELTKVIKACGTIKADDLVVRQLSNLVSKRPAESIEALRLVLESDKEGWRIHMWDDHIRTIIESAIHSSDEAARQMAIEIIDRLGTLGFLNFRDLLPLVER